MRGHPPRVATGLVGLGALAGLAGACAGQQPAVAEGADTERSGLATMDSVRFEDVAGDVGLDVRHSAFRWETGPDPVAMMGGGLCWIDHDNDGWLDLFVVDTWSEGEWGRWRGGDGIPTTHLLANDAGMFNEVGAEAGAALAVRGNGCVAADLDLDGWTDLFVTTERDDVLLWNDQGRGFIDDATLDVPSGAATYGWHAGAAVGDVDGNGWPDLFVAGYTDLNRPIPGATRGFPNPYEPEPDLLFLNDGPPEGTDGDDDGVAGPRVRFREVAARAGIEPDGPDYGLGATLSDLDRDGDLDLYVANDTTANQLYENVSESDASDGKISDGGASDGGASDGGAVRFVERGVEAGVGDEGAGMGVAAADADGDGWPELVTTNQRDERFVLVRNLGAEAEALSFLDARAEAGVPDLGVGSTGWGVSWVDIDLDGDVDLVAANGAIPVGDLAADREPLLILDNDGAGGLADAGDVTGMAELGPYLGRGLAAADYDNDGDVDLAVASIGSPLALLRNTGAGGHWLIVDVDRPIPGAVVTVELAGGRVLRRELLAGGSYLSSEDPRALFGLGQATEVVEVVVTIPGGGEVRRSGVEADRILRIEVGR